MKSYEILWNLMGFCEILWECVEAHGSERMVTLVHVISDAFRSSLLNALYADRYMKCIELNADSPLAAHQLYRSRSLH
jgi:hypothetical protein